MSTPPGNVLEIAGSLSASRVGNALAKATRHLTKTWARDLINVDRNTPTNWEKGRGVAALQWLAIAVRTDPGAIYTFLAEIGARPGAADERPVDEFSELVEDLREEWEADADSRDRITGAVQLAKQAVGLNRPRGERATTA